MRNQQGPRNIDLTRARRAPRRPRPAASAQGASAAQPQAEAQPLSALEQLQGAQPLPTELPAAQAPVQPVVQPSAPLPGIASEDAGEAVAQSAGKKKKAARKKKKARTAKKRKRADVSADDMPDEQLAENAPDKKTSKGAIAVRILLVLLLLLVAVCGYLYWYITSSFQPGEGGTLTETVATPPELSEDIVNILVLGIDYEDDNEREQAMGITREEQNTDLILYVQFNKKENTVNMLQIPRDCFVGPYLDTGGYGRINALYWNAPDPNNRVQYVAECLYDQLGLTVDHYVTIEMQALRELVDTFGGGQGIEVYVPVTMEYDGSRLEQGYHTLTGAELEFFLRQRKDSSATPRGDLDRLNNQRYFYSAIFKYMRTMSWQEMVKLMPVFRQYVNTDISAWDCAALGVALMKVPNENIRMGRLPVYGAQALYDGQYVTGIAAQQTADFLNAYFRPADAPVSVDQLNIYLPAPVSELGAVVDPEMSCVGSAGTVESGDGTDSTSAEQDSAAESQTESDAQAANDAA